MYESLLGEITQLENKNSGAFVSMPETLKRFLESKCIILVHCLISFNVGFELKRQ